MTAADVPALPPGPVWWISTCNEYPDIIFTFQLDSTPTWFFAHQHASILWREYITRLYTEWDRLGNPYEGCERQPSDKTIEREIQIALRSMETCLWYDSN
jgi:hypothetical protein